MDSHPNCAGPGFHRHERLVEREKERRRIKREDQEAYRVYLHHPIETWLLPETAASEDERSGHLQIGDAVRVRMGRGQIWYGLLTEKSELLGSLEFEVRLVEYRGNRKYTRLRKELSTFGYRSIRPINQTFQRTWMR